MGLEPAANAIGASPCFEKDDNAFVMDLFKQFGEKIELLDAGYGIEGMLDCFGRRHLDVNGDNDWFLKSPLGKALYCIRNGGREHEGLTGSRRFVDDGRDVLDEPHVEHPIHFVQHENLQLA